MNDHFSPDRTPPRAAGSLDLVAISRPMQEVPCSTSRGPSRPDAKVCLWPPRAVRRRNGGQQPPEFDESVLVARPAVCKRARGGVRARVRAGARPVVLPYRTHRRAGAGSPPWWRPKPGARARAHVCSARAATT